MNKLKFYATKGISHSGKSSWAKQKAEELGNCVVVTKDDIREAMGANLLKGIRVKESKVIENRNELIIDALKKGQNIISADCNIKIKTDHIANMKALVYPKYRDQYDFEVVDFTNTPFDVILERVEKTDRPEGKEYWKKVVMEQKNNWLHPPIVEQDSTLPKCIISDHDGTIAHVSPNRSAYDGTHSHEDLQNEIVCDYLRMMSEKGYKIFVLSGLEDKFKQQRENWLYANNVPFDALHMRKTSDNRKDCVIKDEIFKEHIEGKYFIHAILDDRNQMTRYWIDKGYMNYLFTIGNPYHEF